MKNLLILILVFTSAQSFTKEFVSLNIEGWTVQVEKSEYEHEELKKSLHSFLESSFKNIKKIIPEDRVNELQKINLWVSSENYPFRSSEKSSIVYHIDPNWLEANKLNRKYAPGVHMINPKVYLLEEKPYQTQPLVLLHELAHGYLHQCLNGSHPKLESAYAYAQASKNYEKVSRVNQSEKVRAYALMNEYEYFSELTEAYYGKNDYYPFDKEELKTSDPIGLGMVKALWSDKCTI